MSGVLVLATTVLGETAIMEEKLRQLQLCELEILNEFVRVCEKNHLRYFLVGGTLLGAVRHGGFIPWDDDVDVAMPREDYEKFAEIAKDELSPDFFYQSSQTDQHYFLPYNKIRKNGTEIFEERFENATFHKGVFIDVFPLDVCPKPGAMCHLIFNVVAVTNRRGEVDSGEKYVPYKELSGKLGYAFLRPYSPRGVIKFRNRFIRLAARFGKKKKCFASFFGAYGYKNEIYPCEWFEATELTFEGRNYVCPAGYDKILSRNYGEDYMQMPPEDKRRTHIATEKIKL